MSRKIFFSCLIPQSFSVRREIYGPGGRDGRNVYFTLAFAGVALMATVFVGVAVAKYRASRSPHAQGFVEVDQVSVCIFYEGLFRKLFVLEKYIQKKLKIPLFIN